MEAVDFVLLCAKPQCNEAQKLRNRYDMCVRNNMTCPLSFEELCTRINDHCNLGELPSLI